MLPLDIRDSVISKLHDTSRKTEEVFMQLAESIPRLVDELHSSITASRENVTCFTGESLALSCSRSNTLRETLQRTQETVAAGSVRFRKLFERDQEIFGNLEAALTQLDKITTKIGNIKLDSEDMELISLNAMTVALKAGNAGRAFSYITEELKRLSTRTISLVDSIFEQGKIAHDDFDMLKKSLEETRKDQESLFSTFQNRINTSTREFEAALNGMFDGLVDIQQRSELLTEPVGRVMESIQLQDIIRQSIDHIVIALEELVEKDSSDPAWLEELSFARQLPDLTEALISDVAGQIRESVALFTTSITEAERQVQEVETERKQFVAGLVNVNGEDISIDEVFSNASNLMGRLLNDLTENVRKKRDLVERSGKISTDVSQLEHLFQSFDPLIMRFHSIDIAGRIEVARQEILQQMGSTVQEMTTLTKKIEFDVNDSLDTTQRFIHATNHIISTNISLSEEQKNFVETFSKTINGDREEMEKGKYLVHEMVGGFSLFTGGFISTFERAKSDLALLVEIADQLENQKNSLSTMKERIEFIYRQSLQERGLTEWNITNDRLKQIIERFTIFTHKQQVGEIAGFEVETGVESGEITFF